MNFLIINILWIIALACLKAYKDSQIRLYKTRVRILEETWTQEPKKK